MLERLPKSRVSGMCMNRSIVTIEPALAGWVVSFEGQALQVLPSKLEAIGFASRRAAEEHRLSGVPCGVSRSEEHTSELQSLMRISYAVFCLKKKTNTT